MQKSLLTFFCLHTLLLFASAQAVSSSTLEQAVPSSNLVAVDFYGEALCPDCAAFTTGALSEVFDTGINELIKLKYFGWGNARNLSGNVVCQHGPAECDLNRVFNCAQELSDSQEMFFTFLACSESKLWPPPPQAHAVIEVCAGKAGLEGQAVLDCASGSQGDQLEAAVAAATAALHPAHTYVPWVVLNGLPLGSLHDRLSYFVCAAYQGQRPKACYAVPDDDYACDALQPVLTSLA